ncbi:MAG TPA: hypothetical protein VEC99_03265 [Clostridia bacterium]|nr:hypothetical protein [Clostridia bacterium]
MKFLKHWKVILTVLLVFAAGGVTGSVLTTIHFKRAFERGLKPENWVAQGMRVLDRQVNLSAEQRPKVRTIMEDTANQFKHSFGQAISESTTNLVVSWHRIDQELTPEQRTIHQRECQKVREKMKQAFNIDLPPQLKNETTP